MPSSTSYACPRRHRPTHCGLHCALARRRRLRHANALTTSRAPGSCGSHIPCRNGYPYRYAHDIERATIFGGTPGHTDGGACVLWAALADQLAGDSDADLCSTSLCDTMARSTPYLRQQAARGEAAQPAGSAERGPQQCRRTRTPHARPPGAASLARRARATPPAPAPARPPRHAL